MSYLAPYVNPQSIWQFSFFGLAYPTLLLGNVIFLIIWAFARKRIFLLSFCCILFGFNSFKNFIGIHPFSESTIKEGTLSVMSFNIHQFKDFKTSTEIPQREFAYQKTREFLDEQNLDAVALQELSNSNVEKIKSKLAFPYVSHISNNNNFIFSKYPIVDKGGKKFPKSGNSYIWADINSPNGIFRMVNLHLQSNHVSPQTDRVLSDRFQKEFNWKNVRDILSTVKHHTNERVNQAKEVQKFVNTSPHPVILCGDFNDTPQSYIYRLLSEGFTDAFESAGWGLGSTYAGKIPGLKIDYVLYPEEFSILKSEVVKVDFSDHYPVVARLKWK